MRTMIDRAQDRFGRRNRLLGLWAAERMGLSGAAAEAYAREVRPTSMPAGWPRLL